MSATRAAGQAQLLSYLPRLSREWASRPEQRRRLIDGSLVFADLSGFTSMTERLASLGRRGAEEVSAIISETFAAMLTEAYRAGGSLLKFGGDALLLLFDGPEHARDAAWGAWGMRQALRTQGTFDTKVGRIRLGMTSAISTGPVHVFMVGEGQKELLVAGPTVSMLMDLERRAARGETLLSEGTVAGLPAGAVTKNQAGLARLSRTPPEAAPRSIDTPTPASSILPFLPPAVRHRHRENEDTLEHRHIAVGFVGIEGLDRLIAADPDRAASALHRVVAATEEAASAHQAWLLATDVARDGAKLIVTAGAPVATGHDEAALLLTLRSLLDLEAELDIRLGANHGTVFFGDIGPSYRRTLTVMGDTVNTAARLMGSAPPDAILAPATMLDSRRVDLEHRAVREMVLRGRKAALQVAEVTGRSTVRRSQEDGPLLGRDRELEALRALLKQAASGRGGTVEVLGPPGSGRSRVAEALLAEADVPSVRLEASLNEQSTPYAVVRRLFTQITGIEPSAPGAASRLRELAASLVPELEPDLAFVTRAMGIDGQDETSLLGVDPRFLPAMTTRSLVTVLDAASPRPLLMVLDDAHLTDSASVEVLRRLGERSSRRPWLLCLTSPEPLNWDWGGVRPAAVELRPLSDDEIVRLAKALTDDRPLSTHELHQVTARAAGNPLALREILSARRQGVELDAIPTAVEGLAAMRIDRLDTRRRRQLEVAAVLGYSFDPSVYESVAGSGVGDLTGWDDDFLEQLDDGRIRFVNPLIRDVIYNRLPFAHRIELHDTVATTLRDRRAVAAEQAAHTLAAERWSEGFAASLDAAREADTRFANIEAIHWYRAALDCAAHLTLPPEETQRIWFQLGELMERSGQYGDAHDAFHRAERLAPSPRDRARIMIRRARMLEQLGSYTTALQALTRARNLAPDSPDVVAAATARYGGIRFLQGKLRPAIALAEEAIAASRGPESLPAEGLALMISDMARAGAGEPMDGSASRRAMEIFDRLGDLARKARVTNNLGMFAFYRGEWDEAARLYSESRMTFERIGDEVNASYGANNLAEIWTWQGRYEEAEELFREVRRIWRAAEDRYGAAYIEGQLALIAAYTGRIPEAERRLAHSIEQFEEIGARAEVTEAAVSRVEIRLLAGDPLGARELMDTFGLEGPAPLGPRMVRLAATVEWQIGGPRSEEAIVTALEEVRRQGSDVDELRLLELCARCGYPQADPERQRHLTRQLGMVVSPVYPR